MDSQRKRIQEIDRLIVQLLEERTEVGKEIARIKEKRGLPIEDSTQEEKVIERAQEQTGVDVEGVFREIIETTKKEMRES